MNRYGIPGAVRQWLGLLVLVAAAVVLAPAGTSARGPEPFLNAEILDLTRYLPQPPEANSDLAKVELQEVLAVQSGRTPEMAEYVKTLSEEGVVQFWVTLGVQKPPVLSERARAFFERIVATEAAVVDPAKKKFGRARPHMVDSSIEPVVRRVTSGAWPSGHAASGWLHAIILADMLPERRDALFKRAEELADSRIVGGIHRRSDIVVGRQAGALIALALQSNADFREEASVVRAEVRALLELPK